MVVGPTEQPEVNEQLEPVIYVGRRITVPAAAGDFRLPENAVVLHLRQRSTLRGVPPYPRPTNSVLCSICGGTYAERRGARMAHHWSARHIRAKRRRKRRFLLWYRWLLSGGPTQNGDRYADLAGMHSVIYIPPGIGWIRSTT